jgi:DNA-binding NarL/FixJ family response regulator
MHIPPSGAEAQSHLPSGAMSINAGPHPSPPVRDTLKCYLVEDSLVIRQGLIATLEEMLGASVIGTAEDEASAVAWLRGHEACDLMIVDIFLKAGSGLQVLQQARLLQPRLNIVVLTNFASAEMRRRCLQLGADRVFDKSAELDELLAHCEALAAAR